MFLLSFLSAHLPLYLDLITNFPSIRDLYNLHMLLAKAPELNKKVVRVDLHVAEALSEKQTSAIVILNGKHHILANIIFIKISI